MADYITPKSYFNEYYAENNVKSILESAINQMLSYGFLKKDGTHDKEFLVGNIGNYDTNEESLDFSYIYKNFNYYKIDEQHQPEIKNTKYSIYKQYPNKDYSFFKYKDLSKEINENAFYEETDLIPKNDILGVNNLGFKTLNGQMQYLYYVQHYYFDLAHYIKREEIKFEDMKLKCKFFKEDKKGNIGYYFKKTNEMVDFVENNNTSYETEIYYGTSEEIEEFKKLLPTQKLIVSDNKDSNKIVYYKFVQLGEDIKVFKLESFNYEEEAIDINNLENYEYDYQEQSIDNINFFVILLDDEKYLCQKVITNTDSSEVIYYNKFILNKDLKIITDPDEIKNYDIGITYGIKKDFTYLRGPEDNYWSIIDNLDPNKIEYQKVDRNKLLYNKINYDNIPNCFLINSEEQYIKLNNNYLIYKIFLDEESNIKFYINAEYTKELNPNIEGNKYELDYINTEPFSNNEYYYLYNIDGKNYYLCLNNKKFVYDETKKVYSCYIYDVSTPPSNNSLQALNYYLLYFYKLSNDNLFVTGIDDDKTFMENIVFPFYNIIFKEYIINYLSNDNYIFNLFDYANKNEELDLIKMFKIIFRNLFLQIKTEKRKIIKDKFINNENSIITNTKDFYDSFGINLNNIENNNILDNYCLWWYDDKSNPFIMAINDMFNIYKQSYEKYQTFNNTEKLDNNIINQINILNEPCLLITNNEFDYEVKVIGYINNIKTYKEFREINKVYKLNQFFDIITDIYKNSDLNIKIGEEGVIKPNE